MAESSAGPTGIRVASPTGRWVVLTTVLGSSMAMLDSTVINVALPRIGEDLGTGLAALQWTVNAYMLTLAGLILLGGALGDRYGRRRVFVVGVVWFAVASLLCGIAPNADVLIAARALQGVGGALLTPGSLALIQASFHPDDRARAVGLWSGLGGVGAAVGPFVGGWLVDGPGWRWVFLLNLPLAAICVPVALRHVPESRDPNQHGRFDVLGAVLGALALALVTYALIEAPGHGASPAVIGAAVGGVLLGAAFVQVERRRPDPMLPPSVFASRQFTAVNLVTLCVYAALGGFFFLSAIQLQVVAGYSALGAGTALLPTTVLMLLFSARSGELGRMDRAAYSAHRRSADRRRRNAADAARGTGVRHRDRIPHRRTPRRRRPRRRPGHPRGTPHRDGPGLRGHHPGFYRQRDQQRRGPRCRADRGGRPAPARRDGAGGLPGRRGVRRDLPAGHADVRRAAGARRPHRLGDRPYAMRPPCRRPRSRSAR